MGHQDSRRCALWVSPEILVRAEELAALLDVDVARVHRERCARVTPRRSITGPIATSSLSSREARKGRCHPDVHRWRLGVCRGITWLRSTLTLGEQYAVPSSRSSGRDARTR